MAEELLITTYYIHLMKSHSESCNKLNLVTEHLEMSGGVIGPLAVIHWAKPNVAALARRPHAISCLSSAAAIIH